MSESKNGNSNQTYQRKWYLKNKEKQLADFKVWKEANPELYKQRKKETYLRSKEKAGYNNPLRLLYVGTRTRAVRRKQVFDLTQEFVEKLWEKQEGKCYYTNLDMICTYGQKSPYQVSIDRIDSSQGYTEANSILCCLSMNYAKSNFSEKEFRDFLLSYKNQK